MLSPGATLAAEVPMRKSRLRRSPQGNTNNHPFSKHLSQTTIILILASVLCLLCFTLIPIWILESMEDPEHHPRTVHGVHTVMDMTKKIRRRGIQGTLQGAFRDMGRGGGSSSSNLLQHNQHIHKISKEERQQHYSKVNKEKSARIQEMAENKPPLFDEEDAKEAMDEEIVELQSEEKKLAAERVKLEKERLKLEQDRLQFEKEKAGGGGGSTSSGGAGEAKAVTPQLPKTADQKKPIYTLKMLRDFVDNSHVTDDWDNRLLARGLAGRPMSETPALEGAKRGRIKCEINVDDLAYWNSPVGKRDLDFETPFGRTDREQYISFTPDHGGWNNVRMSMEILFVFAAATNRTLVMPPKEPLYLLDKDTKAKYRGFVDFFPLDAPNFPVKVISMEDFLQTPLIQEDLNKEKYVGNKTKILQAGPYCMPHKSATIDCHPLDDFMKTVGFNPGMHTNGQLVIFDKEHYEGRQHSEDAQLIKQRNGRQRKILMWNKTFLEHDHFYMDAGNLDWRLLDHFYNYMFFTDPKIGNYMKRFVRDYLHYNDAIFCAAGKVIKAVQKEAVEKGFQLDAEGGGGYSSMHIRHGDFQFKNVQISAQEWYDNTHEIWQEKEIMYIATDERKKPYFDDLAVHYELRFLDDYFDLAGLRDLDPNYFGMIDTIIASRARAFAGTFFSTFTGYINRMRGYHGMTMMDSWYSFLDRKTKTHTWEDQDHNVYQFEWPDGWIGIDADVVPQRDKF